MSNIWDGTHYWIWQVGAIHGGDPQTLLDEAKRLGIRGVLIKFANGDLVGDPVSQAFMDQFKKYAPIFKQAGFVVGGWIYQYLTDPAGEADACFQAIEAGADWLVLDGEVEIQGKDAQVAEFGQLLRAKYPDVKIGMSSFAYQDFHQQVPFAAYNEFVDVFMPQMYWGTIGDTVDNVFKHSLDSFKQYGKPIAPTGQAYDNVTPDQMARFVQLCKDNGLTHVSWWDWQHSTPDQLTGVQNNILTVQQPTAPGPQWYDNAVKYVTERGFMNGDGSGDFKPDEPVTRAELAQALYNLFHQK